MSSKGKLRSFLRKRISLRNSKTKAKTPLITATKKMLKNVSKEKTMLISSLKSSPSSILGLAHQIVP